jgi:hypothetical protein
MSGRDESIRRDRNAARFARGEGEVGAEDFLKGEFFGRKVGAIKL